MSEASETGIEPHAESAHDVAPGDERLDSDALAKGLLGYVIGLALAGGLTIASFVIPASGLVWAPAIPVALIVFAIAQMGVHLVFFLHMSTGPDNTNNALALAFGVLIVVLVIGGSLWIMGHLDHNMLPMNQIMQMQR
jgi:cytochrome o ubiquinol oxidase operon protein cyoD